MLCCMHSIFKKHRKEYQIHFNLQQLLIWLQTIMDYLLFEEIFLIVPLSFLESIMSFAAWKCPDWSNDNEWT